MQVANEATPSPVQDPIRRPEVRHSDSPWVIVLPDPWEGPAGAAVREPALSPAAGTRSGRPGVRSGEGWALEWASAMTSPEKTVLVRSAEELLPALSPPPAIDGVESVLQPADRGTAAGLMLGLARVLERARTARVVVLPARPLPISFGAFRRAVKEAIDASRSPAERLVVVGFVPPPGNGRDLVTFAQSAGWMKPATKGARVHPLVSLSPPRSTSRGSGVPRSALVNSQILVGNAVGLLNQLTLAMPRYVGRFMSWRHATGGRGGLDSLRDFLPRRDYAPDLLLACREALWVLRAEPTG